jgi:HSP20 family protein
MTNPTDTADNAASTPNTPNEPSTDSKTSERFDAARGFTALRDSVGRILEDGLTAIGGNLTLLIDIAETATEIIIYAGPLWGIEPEQIDVSITGDTLTIRGETKPDTAPELKFARRERKFGPFSRSVKIPRIVKPDQSVADFKNAMLIITLPKIEAEQPKIISVRPAL